jgi:hypothetical protein
VNGCEWWVGRGKVEKATYRCGHQCSGEVKLEPHWLVYHLCSSLGLSLSLVPSLWDPDPSADACHRRGGSGGASGRRTVVCRRTPHLGTGLCVCLDGDLCLCLRPFRCCLLSGRVEARPCHARLAGESDSHCSGGVHGAVCHRLANTLCACSMCRETVNGADGLTSLHKCCRDSGMKMSGVCVVPAISLLKFRLAPRTKSKSSHLTLPIPACKLDLQTWLRHSTTFEIRLTQIW